MNKILSRRRLLMGGCAIAGAALVACGGGGGQPAGSSTGSSAVGADSVAVTETATRVTITSAGQRGTHAWSSMQFTFTANVTAGAHKGSTITGLLLLKGERDDDDDGGTTASGVTEVEGRLLVGANPVAGSTSDNSAQGQALRAAFRTQAEALRAALKASLTDLRTRLAADLAAATDDAARLAIKQKFGADFKALMDKFQQDLAALVAQLRDQLSAAGLDPTKFLPGGHDGSKHGSGRGGFEVRGTIDANNHIVGTVMLDAGQTIAVTGDQQADGSYKGTFTGPAGDDAGDWTATAVVVVSAPVKPEPVPVPAPPASAAGT
ncbi:MAG: hypothetical protein U1E90_17085 [Burkholderiaceae bacterium]